MRVRRHQCSGHPSNCNHLSNHELCHHTDDAAQHGRPSTAIISADTHSSEASPSEGAIGYHFKKMLLAKDRYLLSWTPSRIFIVDTRKMRLGGWYVTLSAPPPSLPLLLTRLSLGRCGWVDGTLRCLPPPPLPLPSTVKTVTRKMRLGGWHVTMTSLLCWQGVFVWGSRYDGGAPCAAYHQFTRTCHSIMPLLRTRLSLGRARAPSIPLCLLGS
jgi:hypothetical protein